MVLPPYWRSTTLLVGKKSVAIALIRHFGSLKGLARASFQELRQFLPSISKGVASIQIAKQIITKDRKKLVFRPTAKRSKAFISASIQAERKSIVLCDCGRTRPGLASVEVLPARVDSSIHSDVFARHERSVLEIEHCANYARDFTHPSEGVKFRQRILIGVCVHRDVHPGLASSNDMVNH